MTRYAVVMDPEYMESAPRGLNHLQSSMGAVLDCSSAYPRGVTFERVCRPNHTWEVVVEDPENLDKVNQMLKMFHLIVVTSDSLTPV